VINRLLESVAIDDRFSKCAGSLLAADCPLVPQNAGIFCATPAMFKDDRNPLQKRRSPPLRHDFRLTGVTRGARACKTMPPRIGFNTVMI
jgi:hypothetical protein